MYIKGRRTYAENWSVNVGIGATAAIWTYQIPHKARARMIGFGNYLGTVAAWGVAYWYFTCNNVPQALFTGTGAYLIYDQVGYAAQRQPCSDEEYAGGSTLVIYGVNATAAALDMGISIEYEEIYPQDL